MPLNWLRASPSLTILSNAFVTDRSDVLASTARTEPSITQPTAAVAGAANTARHSRSSQHRPRVPGAPPSCPAFSTAVHTRSSAQPCTVVRPAQPAAAHARARVCHFQATQVQPQLHARTCEAPETVPATWVFPTPATARHNRTHSQRAHGPQLRAGGTHPNTARARTRKPATPQLRHTARHTTHNRRCAPHNAPSTTAVRQRTPARRAAENRRGATHTHPMAGRVVRTRALPKTKQPRRKVGGACSGRLF